jgi:predicted nucleic acid-binding protein
MRTRSTKCVTKVRLPVEPQSYSSNRSTASPESERHEISHLDALILAANKSADAAAVYSEELSHTQNYGGMPVVNPFVQDVTAL